MKSPSQIGFRGQIKLAITELSLRKHFLSAFIFPAAGFFRVHAVSVGGNGHGVACVRQVRPEDLPVLGAHVLLRGRLGRGEAPLLQHRDLCGPLLRYLGRRHCALHEHLHEAEVQVSTVIVALEKLHAYYEVLV